MEKKKGQGEGDISHDCVMLLLYHTTHVIHVIHGDIERSQHPAVYIVCRKIMPLKLLLWLYFGTAHSCKILQNPDLTCGAPCPKGQLTRRRTSTQNVKRERNNTKLIMN